MKKRTSIKKRSADDQIIRRKGKVRIINKKNPRFKQVQGQKNMAMLAGVNIPDSQRIEIGLTAISGIGRSTSKKIISDVGIDVNTRVKDLQEDEMARIRSAIERSQIRIEGDLRREVSMNIKRLIDLASYRGSRHKKKLPVRGQRTHCNARTRKGKAIAIAGKKLTPLKK